MAKSRNGRTITGEEHANHQAAKYLMQDKGINVSLYDVQKIEILKELYNQMSLESLQTLKCKLQTRKLLR